MLLRKIFSGIRQGVQIGRSVCMRLYLYLAFPGIKCHPTVSFGRGLTIFAYDGGLMEIGAGTRIDDGARVVVQGGRLIIGKDCLIGRGAGIECLEDLSIGDGTLIAEYVTIRDQDHRHEGDGRLDDKGVITAPIKIGNDCWLGAKCTITRGVEIAPHSVIAANAVVTRSALIRGIYGGVPARLIKPTV